MFRLISNSPKVLTGSATRSMCTKFGPVTGIPLIPVKHTPTTSNEAYDLARKLEKQEHRVKIEKDREEVRKVLVSVKKVKIICRDNYYLNSTICSTVLIDDEHTLMHGFIYDGSDKTKFQNSLRVKDNKIEFKLSDGKKYSIPLVDKYVYQTFDRFFVQISVEDALMEQNPWTRHFKQN